MLKYLSIASLLIVFAAFPALAVSHEVAPDNAAWSFLQAYLPAWAMVAIVILRQVAEIIAKNIPDSAEGGLGLLRKVFKIIAIYVPNKS